MPILQDNFPFIQKSSRTLVRVTWMLPHVSQDRKWPHPTWRWPWFSLSVTSDSSKWCMNVCFWQKTLKIDCYCSEIRTQTSGAAIILLCEWNLTGGVTCVSLQECYVHNVLRVTTYMPSIRRDALELIIGKMLQQDVSASTPKTFYLKHNTANPCGCKQRSFFRL